MHFFKYAQPRWHKRVTFSLPQNKNELKMYSPSHMSLFLQKLILAWGWVHFHQIFDILFWWTIPLITFWIKKISPKNMKCQSASSAGNQITGLCSFQTTASLEELYISLIGTEMAWRESSALPELQLAVCVLSLALVPHHLDVGLSLSVTWKFECLCSDGLHLVLWAVFLWWWWWQRRLILFTTVWILQFNQSHVLQGKRIWLS